MRPPQHGQGGRSAGSAAAREVRLTPASREQAVMPYPVKTLGQDVQQEAPDEFIYGERHRSIARCPIAPIILDAGGDATAVERDQPVV